MSFNWITCLLLIIVAMSTLQGCSRRFAGETAHLAFQVLSLASGLSAGLIAWLMSSEMSRVLKNLPRTHFPTWLWTIVDVWREQPTVAQIVTFLIGYMLLTTILHFVLGGLPSMIARIFPERLGKSVALGGAIGLFGGMIRATGMGAVVFVVLQLVSFPALSMEASKSSVYACLESWIYRPWLKPWLVREWPVLSEGALAPLSQGINMFVVPTSLSGDNEGVLIVPRLISTLAHQIVKGDTTPTAKAYALYEWEIHHVCYDWNKYDDFVYHGVWDQQSPLETLESGKGVCADYALLYADMAHSVGLNVRIDEGIGGTAQNSGPHAWNEIYDSQSARWIPLDTTWGSEQDVWFGPPNFFETHVKQTTIFIPGGAL